MSEKITTLSQVADVLETQGYKLQLLENEAVMLDIGGSEQPFVAVITENKAESQFIITCQLAVLGDIDEEKSAQFMLAALDANSQLRPYAFAILSDSDDAELEDENKWPIVLTSSMPVGDLSNDELMTAIDDLWQALTTAGPVLKLGLTK